MKEIAAGTYRLGLYEKSMPNVLTIREKLQAARKAGFDFMELSVDESDEKLSRLKWSNQQKAELVKASRETGMQIMTMCLSGHRKYPIGSEVKAIRLRGMEIMSDAIRFASETGLRIIQIAGYDEYYNPSNENTRRLFLENLGRSVEMSAAYGVILAFETMETELMNTVGKAMHYVDEIDSPYLQIYPDLGNITNAACLYGHDVLDDLRSGRGHLAAMHLKETVPGRFREIPFGMGHVDFTGAILEALRMGVRLFVGEFWHTGGNDWQSQLTRAHRFLRSKFI
jgi:L-ribulose-5-phosphate 3-epimerase